MIKLVVFDWNGTLFADSAAAVHGANARLAFLGLPTVTLKQYREAFEMPAANTYINLGVDPELLKTNYVELAKAFHETYEERAKRVRTRSGTRQVLRYLDQHKVSKIIFSNHTVVGIEYQLRRLKIAHHFDAVLANEDILISHHKGKKHRLIEYLQATKFKPDEVLIVGDSPEEVHIGKELGLKTVALTGGFTDTKRLKATKPDVLIHKLHDLIAILEN